MVVAVRVATATAASTAQAPPEVVGARARLVSSAAAGVPAVAVALAGRACLVVECLGEVAPAVRAHRAVAHLVVAGALGAAVDAVAGVVGAASSDTAAAAVAAVVAVVATPR